MRARNLTGLTVLIFAFVFLVDSAWAKIKVQGCSVRYKHADGSASSPVIREILLLSGAELASSGFRPSYPATVRLDRYYVELWFGPGQVSISEVDLLEALGTSRFDRPDLDHIYQSVGRLISSKTINDDLSGRIWEILLPDPLASAVHSSEQTNPQVPISTELARGIVVKRYLTGTYVGTGLDSIEVLDENAQKTSFYCPHRLTRQFSIDSWPVKTKLLIQTYDGNGNHESILAVAPFILDRRRALHVLDSSLYGLMGWDVRDLSDQKVKQRYMLIAPTKNAYIHVGRLKVEDYEKFKGTELGSFAVKGRVSDLSVAERDVVTFTRPLETSKDGKVISCMLEAEKGFKDTYLPIFQFWVEQNFE